MPTILVDYENVNGSDGLRGADTLCKKDTLIIVAKKYDTSICMREKKADVNFGL